LTAPGAVPGQDFRRLVLEHGAQFIERGHCGVTASARGGIEV